jgi:hypothetical protein
VQRRRARRARGAACRPRDPAGERKWRASCGSWW